MRNSEIISLVIRYGILLVLGLAISVIYVVMTPLTVYPAYYVFNTLYTATFYPPNVIAFKGYFAHIIEACVAGAAYYFLLILNLTTPMRVAQRVKSLVFLLGSFYVLNVVRIILFGMLFYKGFKYFDFAHIGTWYAGSTILVVALWFLNIKLFKITSVPGYSDMKRLVVATKNL